MCLDRNCIDRMFSIVERIPSTDLLRKMNTTSKDRQSVGLVMLLDRGGEVRAVAKCGTANPVYLSIGTITAARASEEQPSSHRRSRILQPALVDWVSGRQSVYDRSFRTAL